MLHNKRFATGYVPRFQKTYLSREMTRAMSIEHPIGDPHGGPAYGERNDPISATIAIGTMFASGSAIAASGLTLMTGLSFAGAALSLVGNISGNKTLSKIGMIVGIAGGIGAIAQNAGMFAAEGMADLAGNAGYGDVTGLGASDALSQTANISQGAGGGAITSPISMPDMPQGVDLGGLGADTASLTQAPVSQVAAQASAPVPTSGPVGGGAGSPLAQTTPLSGAPAAPTALGVDAPTAPGYQSIGNPAAPGQPGSGWQYFSDPATSQGVAISPEGKFFGNGLGNAPMEQLTGAGGQPMGFGDYANQAWQGIKGIGSSFMDLAKSNPGAAYMLGQGVSSLGDVLSGKADAQINALEAQGDLSKAQAEKLRFEMEEYKRKVQQRNSNYTNVANPLSTWKPNFQTTMTPQPGAGGGLIGGAMQPGP